MSTNVNVTGTASVTGNTFSGTGSVNGTLTFSVTASVADVTNLAVATTSSSFTATWTPPVGASSYLVDWRSVIPGVTPTNSYNAAVSVSGSTYTLSSGLSAGTSYQVRVRAVFPGGTTATGVTVTATLPDATVVPTAPASFRVTNSSTSSISVAWNPVSGASGYRVYIRPTSGSYGTVPNASPAGTAYDFVGLASATSYTMRVLAYASNTEGPASEITFATPASTLGDPSSLAVSAFTDSTVSVSWSAGSGAASHLVDWKVTSGGAYGLPVEVTTNAYTVLQLTPGVGYTIRVRSKAGTTVSTGATVTQTTLGTSGGTGTLPTETVVGSYSGTGPVVVTKPASSSGESYYIAVAYKSGDAQTLTTPTGYTLVADVNGTGHPGRIVLYEKVSSGESAGTVSITASGSVDAAWIMLRTRGARRAYATLDTSYTNPAPMPTVTTTTVNAPVFHFVASGQWPRTWQAPAGYTLLGQTYAASGPGLGLGFRTVDSAATGNQSYTAMDPATSVATGDDFVGVSLALDGAPVAEVLSGNISGSSVTANTPAANAGDSLYLAISHQDGSAYTVATPSGWTLVQAQNSAVGGPGGFGTLTVFRKDLPASVAAATVSVTFSGSVTGSYTASRHRGTFRASAKATGTASTSFVAPSVTATVDNSTLITWVAPGHYPRTHTPPAGMTELADQLGGGANGPSLAVGSKSVSAGATGTTTWTADSSDDYNAVSVVIDGTGGNTGGGGTGGGGGGNTTTSFYVGSHVHGYGTSDRYASGTYPATNGPSGDNTMYPAKFGSFRSWDNESDMGRLAYWTGRTGGIDASGDSKNTYDWTAVNAVLDNMSARGHTPFMLTFCGTPAWAARNQDASSYGNGRMSIPTNIAAWGQAVRDCVIHVRTRYGTDSVKWVEIGNECIGSDDYSNNEVSQFLNARGWPAGSSTPIATLYADMVGAAAPLVKGVSAAIQIVVGAHTYTNEHWTRMLMAAKTQGGTAILSYADVFSVHLYGFSRRNPYRDLATKTAQIRQWLTEYGYGSLPLADTEFGFYYPWGGSAEMSWYASLSDQQKQDYIYESIADRKALGYVGAWWYSCDASPSPGNLSFFYEPERTAFARSALNSAYVNLNV